MKNRHLRLLTFVLLMLGLGARADTGNPNTGWFSRAKYGVFVHFLPAGAEGLEQVSKFDVAALAAQLDEMGAGYLMLTLGQNSGYFNAPNTAYDKRAGYAAGARCAARDLPLELARVLRAKGIRLMLYLPCQVPNRDAQAQRAFGLAEGPKDQPIDLVFAEKWAEVIQEWSDRYGDLVAGWWFDGGYQHIGFNDAIAARYAAAARHGNPKSIVTFNPGVKVIRWTRAEDYTAGELNEPLSEIPTGRWLDGSQWHALTFIGDMWGRRNTRFSDAQWVEWTRKVTARGGVVTFDMGPNYDAAAGPVGQLAAAQVAQVKAVRAALRPGGVTEVPTRWKRAESFFGVHFDFHAGADCTEVGKNTTPAMVERILEAARPDYLQTDCKGHPGYSSYPTRVGNPAPGFVGDPLRIWRDVTAREGVALYVHYSGVWDSRAIELHPGWGAVNADGKTNGNATSFFSPYADQLLVPQLRELAGVYGVDGAWVDGECWASVADYGARATEVFRLEMRTDDVPRRRGDPRWYEFLQFHRQAFRSYLRHYIQEVKRTDPEFQLCSNWAFTDHMPEPVCAPVDWISGDFSPEDAVNSARFSGRYLAHQGKPWDLMAWGFTINGEARNGSRQKTAVQLEREAAVVLSLGGGFQSYYTQRRDGSVSMDYLPVIKEVAAFCRARQPFCQGATPVPQIALLYSTASHYREVNGLFNRDLGRLAGTLQALVGSQCVVDVVGEHVLAGRMAEYPLIVVGECDYLEPEFRRELSAYAENGGSLLVVGPRAAALFSEALDVDLGDARTEARHLAVGDAWVATRGETRAPVLKARARALGALHTASEVGSPSQPAASVARWGQGKVGAIYFEFSRGYLEQRSPALRTFLADLVRELFPNPLVEVKGSSEVDVTVNRVPAGLAVNLVNTSGAHWDTRKPLIDAIAALGPLELKIRKASKPTRVTYQPDGQPLAFEYRDGLVRTTVPRVDIHGIVVVE